MSSRLDINEMHIEAETTDEVVKIYQECHLDRFVDDGNKLPDLPPYFKKSATTILFICLFLYILDLFLISSHSQFSTDWNVALFALALLLSVIMTIAIQHLLKSKLISGLALGSLIIISGFVEGITNKEQTMKALQNLWPTPKELIEKADTTIVK